MKQSKSDGQLERVRQVCNYIGQHLDEELNLTRLSQVGLLSRFHFHRLFLATTGMQLSRYILLLRLKRASFRLAFESKRKILDIGIESGFDSAEAFSRAFKRTFQQSPSQFRSNPDWPHWHSVMTLVNPPQGDITVDVKIIELPVQKVAQLEHCGAPEKLMETAKQFIEWRKTTGLSPVATSRTYGVPNGDPNTMAAEDFRFRFCGSVNEAVPGNEYGVVTGTLAGGCYAVIRHEGSHDAMESSIYGFFREWLPQSGKAMRDEPLFFHYLNFIHQVDECDLLTDIYLPLE